MNDYSTRLAWAGAMIGALALTATVFANSRPPGKPSDTTAPTLPALVAEPVESTEEVAAVMAPETMETAGPFLIALRVEELPLEGRLFLCDASGCPIEEAKPYGTGDVTLGPVFSGVYSLWRDGTELGGFRLLQNASLDEARGQLWTDGELLHFERFCPGTASIRLTLRQKGFFSFTLYDRNGRQWNRDLFIPDSALPERGLAYVRTLEFRGLRAGTYTLVRRETPILQVLVQAGERTEAEATVE